MMKGSRARIRAQLLNIKTKKLEMDFVIQSDSKSLHVPNAVSPAWTCALPFAKYVCDKIQALRAGVIGGSGAPAKFPHQLENCLSDAK
jgi:hypothetical protein